MVVSQADDSGGEIEEQEQEMLYKVFDFADKEASDVMVPRPEVVALSIDLPPEQCLEAVIESPYTRYPVYRETLDNVVGILHVRDLFAALRDRGMHEVKIEDLIRPAHIVPETKDLARAARPSSAARTSTWRSSSTSTASMEGIVTLEDLLEEIVGEIEDEFDLPDESVEQVDEDTIRIDGTFPIDDFNERFRTEPAGRGLPHARRLRLRPARPSAGGRATTSRTTACASTCSTSRARASTSSRSTFEQRRTRSSATARNASALEADL